MKDDTFELCYNKACLVLGQGDYTEALTLLDRAEQLCKESLEDDPVRGLVRVITYFLFILYILLYT